MKTILLLITAVLFSGCMHTMMMGSHGESQSKTMIVLEKEVTVGTIKAIATIPPFEMEKEVVVSVKLFDTETSSPLSNAEVVCHFTPKGKEDSESHQHEGNEYIATEKERGMYAISFTPSHADEYSIHIQVRSIQGRTPQQPITIETTREVTGGAHDNHSGGMHGSGSSSPMYIIGGVVMVTMMVGMFALRGMF
ncbi:MAG: hypothetical protein HY960_09210 [Ignavibacteriae bacterium]|nr:hypothetical protein [Ignavibacteriota bacterium]